MEGPRGVDVSFVLSVLRAAAKYKLPALLARCEGLLVPAVDVRLRRSALVEVAMRR